MRLRRVSTQQGMRNQIGKRGIALTVALAHRRSLDPASAGHRQRPRLVDGDAERGGAAVENRAEARRLRLDDAGQLRAAGGGRRGGVAGDVVEARRKADDRSGATGRRLRGSSP